VKGCQAEWGLSSLSCVHVDSFTAVLLAGTVIVQRAPRRDPRP